LSAQADQNLRKQELNDSVEEKDKDRPAKEKNQRRQGTSERKVAIEFRFMSPIPEATKPLIDGCVVGMHPFSFAFEAQTCLTYKALLLQEVVVP
jgi:hypothetical protein